MARLLEDLDLHCQLSFLPSKLEAYSDPSVPKVFDAFCHSLAMAAGTDSLCMGRAPWDELELGSAGADALSAVLVEMVSIMLHM